MIATAPNTTTDFEQLWNDYSHRIRMYIRRHVMSKDIDTVNDLTSDVFLKAIEAMQRGQGAHSHLSGWLFRIARNRVIDHYRSMARRDKVIQEPPPWNDTYEDFLATDYHDDLLDVPSRDLSPHEQVEQAITQAHVRRAISRLTDSQANAVTLRLEGYAFSEIAEMTGNTEGGAKQLNTRAYATLRNQLRDIV